MFWGLKAVGNLLRWSDVLSQRLGIQVSFQNVQEVYCLDGGSSVLEIRGLAGRESSASQSIVHGPVA